MVVVEAVFNILLNNKRVLVNLSDEKLIQISPCSTLRKLKKGESQ